MTVWGPGACEGSGAGCGCWGSVGTGVWALGDPWWQSAAAGGVEGRPPSPRDRQKGGRRESGFEFAGIWRVRRRGGIKKFDFWGIF